MNIIENLTANLTPALSVTQAAQLIGAVDFGCEDKADKPAKARAVQKTMETPDGAVLVYHPTKGYRRISASRMRAQARLREMAERIDAKRPRRSGGLAAIAAAMRNATGAMKQAA